VRAPPADVLMVEDDPGDALMVHLAAASCVVMAYWRDHAHMLSRHLRVPDELAVAARESVMLGCSGR
jgi:hypothetical protein